MSRAPGSLLSAVVAGWVLAAVGCDPPDAAVPSAPPPAVVSPAAGGEEDLDLAARAAGLHHGVDVSGHSGEVDWLRVKDEGHTFAVVKATEGIDLRDPSFERHWRELHRAGIVRGAYHFYVTEDDPVAQAEFFLGVVTLEPGDLAPVVDVELVGHGTEPGLADRLHTWLRIVEERAGVKPIVYTTAEFWNEHLGEGFGGHPLWVAEYEVDEPRLPVGWGAWHLWQWKGDAEVPGVEKSADLSRVNRAGADLTSLLVPAAAARAAP